MRSLPSSWLAGLRQRSRLSSPAAPVPPERIAPIRRAMRDALDSAPAARQAALALRIEHAADAQRLWHLRGDLMQVLAAAHGERRATEQVRAITALFDEILPGGLAACLSGPRLARTPAAG